MKKYFRGLDTLRAIAALVVVIGHVELIKDENGTPKLFKDSFLRLADGHIAVILFFVLSGFLITYLLVKEKEKTGRISLKKFYMRRIFRIWPLYYCVILLSFLLIHANYKLSSIILCLGIFPNFAHAFQVGWPTSPQIWSIGVEEQFYLLWPLLITLIPSKKIIFYLILFFIGYTLLPHFIGFVNVRTFHNDTVNNIVNRFFYGSKFNCMSVGCILGYMYATHHKWLNVLYNKYLAYMAIIFSFLLWFSRFELKYFTEEFYAVIFGIMILNIATNDNLKLNIDTKITGFLGKISYGIYMYHYLIILIIVRFLPYHNYNNIYIYNFIIYTTAVSATIFVSWISFITMEKYFLNLKARFETK